MWGGLTDWDGRPDDIQIEDPIRVFKETMDLGQGIHGWGRYVVYVTFLQQQYRTQHLQADELVPERVRDERPDQYVGLFGDAVELHTR